MSVKSDVREKRILCVGMCILDVVHICETYPEENSIIEGFNSYWQRGGNASNYCTVLRYLGANCEFLGMLSNSEAFTFLSNDLQENGIITDACPRTSNDPPFTSVFLSQTTDTRTIIYSNSNFPPICYDDFERINLNDYNWIHFEARIPHETKKMLQQIIDFNAIHVEKIRTSLDLDRNHVENLILVEFVDLVFLGKDLAKILGFKDCKSAVYGLLERVATKLKNRPLPTIICTWGSEGSCCLDGNGGDYYFVPTKPPSAIIDTLGAGDTYCAATIYALSVMNKSLVEAVTFGSCCAGYKIGNRGFEAIGRFLENENSCGKVKLL